jgi:hypothetical protein
LHIDTFDTNLCVCSQFVKSRWKTDTATEEDRRREHGEGHHRPPPSFQEIYLMDIQSLTIDVIPLILVQNESINWEKCLPAEAEDALLSHWTHLYKESSESGGWNFLDKFVDLVKHHYPRTKSHGMERCIVHFWLFRVESSDFRPLSRRILEHWKLQ